MNKTILLFLYLLLQNSNSYAQFNTPQMFEGTSIQKEAFKWSTLISLTAFNKFYLADLKPFPNTPLLKTHFKSLLNKETVPDRLIYSSAALLNSAIFLLPNKYGWMNKYSYRHCKGFVESCIVYTPVLTTFTKLIVGKKRPYYDITIHKNDNDARKSFWSGHTSSTFSMVTYFNLYLYKYINQNNTKNLFWKIPLSVLLYSAAIYTAKSRVDDHAHDYLDVSVGACAGTGISIIIFQLHEKQ